MLPLLLLPLLPLLVLVLVLVLKTCVAVLSREAAGTTKARGWKGEVVEKDSTTAMVTSSFTRSIVAIRHGGLCSNGSGDIWAVDLAMVVVAVSTRLQKDRSRSEINELEASKNRLKANMNELGRDMKEGWNDFKNGVRNTLNEIENDLD